MYAAEAISLLLETRTSRKARLKSKGGSLTRERFDGGNGAEGAATAEEGTGGYGSVG
jgi:hypothetical protein